MSKHKFTLWWIPSRENQSRLQPVIDSLAREHSTPVFSPHITVCHSIEDEDTATELGELIAKSYQPFEVTPERLEHTDAFYRAFYIRLKLNDSLRGANALWAGQSEPYLPHLSLMYQVESRFDPVVFQQCPDDILRGFEIDRLDLLDASGKIQDWRLIHSFLLVD